MNKVEKILHTLYSLIGIGLVFCFAIYWFNPANLPRNVFGSNLFFINVLLFVILSYILWHPIVMQILVWSIAAHIKRRKTPLPQPGKKVAFVTTYVPGSESIELLEKTLPAIVNVDYPHDTWLLDEGNDKAARDLCEKLGVHHFSRHGNEKYNAIDGKFARKTKGGNHNSWYDTYGRHYDYVAQIDTDFIPQRNFLTATLGYFQDSNVAFVGTPQVYGNESQSIIARGAAQQTYNFYGTLLRGMDGMDTTLLIGANHVIRVAALKNVDFYSPHITEDLLTGMKLHAKGWKSVYVPKVLAVGEGPVAWKAYFNQQKRWAYGCMNILLKHSPRLFKTMGVRRVAYYFLLQQHYFTGVAMGLSALLLALYFITGISTATISLVPFVTFYGSVVSYLLFMQLWLQRFNVRPKQERGLLFAGMYINFAAWPIYLIAFLSLFKRKKLVYKVTPKGKTALRQKDRIALLFVPHYIIAATVALAVIAGELMHRTNIVMEFWAVMTVAAALIVPTLIPARKTITLVKVTTARQIAMMTHKVVAFPKRVFVSFENRVSKSGISE